jgi:hypothetical protein
MLVKLCLEEDVPLVAIVRKPEQVEMLRSIGAVHVCDSSSSTFMPELIDALSVTSATIAFDAIGGGKLVSYILTAMEAAANASAQGYSRYGSTVHKQVYIYGGLDPTPTTLTRSFGFAWGLGGWLLTPFLGTLDLDTFSRLRARVADGLKTTLSSAKLRWRSRTRSSPQSPVMPPRWIRVSRSAPGPATSAKWATALRRRTGRQTARFDVGHGDADDAPLDVEDVRNDVATEDRGQDQLQHDEEDHRDRPLPHQRGEPEADDEPDGRLQSDPQSDIDHQGVRRDDEVGAVVRVVLIGHRDREHPNLSLRLIGGDGDRPAALVWITVPDWGPLDCPLPPQGTFGGGRSTHRPRGS